MPTSLWLDALISGVSCAVVFGVGRFAIEHSTHLKNVVQAKWAFLFGSWLVVRELLGLDETRGRNIYGIVFIIWGLGGPLLAGLGLFIFSLIVFPKTRFFGELEQRVQLAVGVFMVCATLLSRYGWLDRRPQDPRT